MCIRDRYIYTRSGATCSFSYFISDKPLRSTRQHFYCAAFLLRCAVYRHASHSSDHKDLPVITTTCVPSHTCTRSWPYLFIFILLFWLTAKIDPSTFLLRCNTLFTSFIFMLLFRLTTKTYLSPQLLVYLPIAVPVHDPTCSFSYFNSD